MNREEETDFGEFNIRQQEYRDFVGGDPVRNYLHYPAIVAEMPGIRGKKILDVGCGDGYFAIMLAKKFGANVVGYDRGEQLIEAARQAAGQEAVGVQFQVADAQSFTVEKPFDFATSVMVLPYASDEESLVKYFNSTCCSLAEGGKFISIVLNPGFKNFGEIIPNRKMTPLVNNKIEVQFLDPKTGALKLTGVLKQFSKESYNKAASEGGFSSVEWKGVHPTAEGLRLGDAFWEKVIIGKPYSLLIARK